MVAVTAIGWALYGLFRPMPLWHAVPEPALAAVRFEAGEKLAKHPLASCFSGIGRELGHYDVLCRQWGFRSPYPGWLALERANRDSLSSVVIWRIPRGWSPPGSAFGNALDFEGRRYYETKVEGKTLYWARYRGALLVAAQGLVLEESLEAASAWRPGLALKGEAEQAPLHWRADGSARDWLSFPNGNGWTHWRRKATPGKDLQWVSPLPGGSRLGAPLGSWVYVSGLPDQVVAVAPRQVEPASGWGRWVAPWVRYPLLRAHYGAQVVYILPADRIEQASAALREADPSAAGYKYLNFTIRELRQRDLFPNADGYSGGWWLSADGAIVFAHDKDELQRWADHYLVGATFDKNEAFLRAAALMPGGIGGWMSAAEADRLADDLFPDWAAPDWLTSGANYVMGIEKDALVLLVQRSGAATEGRSWRYELSGGRVESWQPLLALDSAAAVVGVAVQDQNRWVHLLDPDGRPQWRFQADGPVVSPVYRLTKGESGRQVRYLFNTATRVYLLDAAGRPDHRLDLPLSAPATAAMLVVDTSGVGGYAFYLPTANGQINAWRINGAPAGIRNLFPSGDYTGRPLRFVRFSDRDFLVANDAGGIVKGLSRRGETRFTVLPDSSYQPLGPWAVWQAAGQDALQQSRLVNCDAAGKLLVANFQGQQFPLRAEGNGAVTHWELANISGDSRPEYILQRGAGLEVFGYKGKAFGLLKRLPLPPGVTAWGVLEAGDQSWWYALLGQEGSLLVAPGESELSQNKSYPADHPPYVATGRSGKKVLITVFRGVVNGFAH